MINLKKTLFSAMLAFIAYFGISNNAYGNDNTTTIELKNISKSPDVHEFIDGKIKVKQLAEKQYDLRNFKAKITIKEVDCKNRGEEGDYVHFVFNKISKVKDRSKIDSNYMKKIANIQGVREFAKAFQLAEAEAVFYRDLKGVMDDKHKFLMNIQKYEDKRSANNSIVVGLFNVTEGILHYINFIFNCESRNNNLDFIPITDNKVQKRILRELSKSTNNLNNNMAEFRDKNHLPK